MSWNLGTEIFYSVPFAGTDKIRSDFLAALLGLCRSDLGKCLLWVWNGGKHLCTSKHIDGGDLKSSEPANLAKTLYSHGFRWVFRVSMDIVGMSSFVSQINAPGRGNHDFSCQPDNSGTLNDWLLCWRQAEGFLSLFGLQSNQYVWILCVC